MPASRNEVAERLTSNSSVAGSSLPAIRLEDVSVRFSLNGHTVVPVSNLSLHVEGGETVVLVGPSGCGKTTLLNVVAGFIEPDAGRVYVGDTLVQGPGRDRAVVFQADAVFPWLTVRRNLEYGLRLRGALDAAGKESVRSLLNTMGLAQFSEQFPKVLSGGMRKRVDVARAYANDPAAILLDEPFGALDDMTKSRLQEELGRLRKVSPKTTMFVTHDLEEAIYVGDRVVVMAAHPGRIVDIVDVPYKGERPPEIRTTREFQELRRHLQGLLRTSEAN